jgi:hypothetical protein
MVSSARSAADCKQAASFSSSFRTIKQRDTLIDITLEGEEMVANPVLFLAVLTRMALEAKGYDMFPIMALPFFSSEL